MPAPAPVIYTLLALFVQLIKYGIVIVTESIVALPNPVIPIVTDCPVSPLNPIPESGAVICAEPIPDGYSFTLFGVESINSVQSAGEFVSVPFGYLPIV